MKSKFCIVLFKNIIYLVILTAVLLIFTNIIFKDTTYALIPEANVSHSSERLIAIIIYSVLAVLIIIKCIFELVKTKRDNK